MKLLAFHNDPAIKAKYVQRVKAHALADEIVHGQYWTNGKGCAVGCTVHSGSHFAFEQELGIPQTIARLEDHIFEGLANGHAKDFPLQFLESIQVGADLSKVWPNFAIWLLTDEAHGVRQHATPKGQQAIDAVTALYRRQLSGETVSQTEWRAAAAAADAAYAADAYAAYAAAAAAYAAYAAADAAYAAAAAAAADDAEIKFWEGARDQLLKLLAEAPVLEIEN